MVGKGVSVDRGGWGEQLASGSPEGHPHRGKGRGEAAREARRFSTVLLWNKSFQFLRAQCWLKGTLHVKYSPITDAT